MMIGYGRRQTIKPFWNFDFVAALVVIIIFSPLWIIPRMKAHWWSHRLALSLGLAASSSRPSHTNWNKFAEISMKSPLSSSSVRERYIAVVAAAPHGNYECVLMRRPKWDHKWKSIIHKMFQFVLQHSGLGRFWFGFLFCISRMREGHSMAIFTKHKNWLHPSNTCIRSVRRATPFSNGLTFVRVEYGWLVKSTQCVCPLPRGNYHTRMQSTRSTEHPNGYQYDVIASTSLSANYSTAMNHHRAKFLEIKINISVNCLLFAQLNGRMIEPMAK